VHKAELKTEPPPGDPCAWSASKPKQRRDAFKDFRHYLPGYPAAFFRATHPPIQAPEMISEHYPRDGQRLR